jgi:hypothetical protein
MKFVSTEQVFDALVNAAVVERIRHSVRDWYWERLGRDQRNMGCAAGGCKTRPHAWRSRMVALSLLGSENSVYGGSLARIQPPLLPTLLVLIGLETVPPSRTLSKTVM